MSKNDFCRCCKKNLRIHGELTNTISIFERNSKGECTYEQVLRLGEALFGDVVDYVTVDHLSIIV